MTLVLGGVAGAAYLRDFHRSLAVGVGTFAAGALLTLATVLVVQRRKGQTVEQSSAVGAAPPGLSPVLVEALSEANVIRFTPARSYYARYKGHGSITDYVAQAQERLVIVGVNLMTGDSSEKILNTFASMLNRDRPVEVTISLLDPDQSHLMEALAGNLELSPVALSQSIRDLIQKIQQFADTRLTDDRKRLLALHCHRVLPSASAILIDPDSDWGRIQLETKAYQARLIDAYGFEVAQGSPFYRMLRTSYLKLVADGRRVV